MTKRITKSQKKFIKKSYSHLSPEEIAKRLQLPPEDVRKFIHHIDPHQKTTAPLIPFREPFLERYAEVFAGLLVFLYISFFSFLSIRRYYAFNYSDFDLAIYNQTMWNIVHGSLDSSILGIPFLGNHLDLTLFFLIPVYLLFPSPITLLVLQTIFLGLAVIPLFLVARVVLDKKFALVLSAIYLLYPPLHYVNRFEFHPVSFVVVFLFFAFYFFEKQKFPHFLGCIFFALLCKENIALGVFFFGLYALLFRRRPWRWSLVPMGIATLWLMGGVRVLQHFNQGVIDFDYIYSHIGRSLPEAIGNILKDPLKMSPLVFNQRNMVFLFQLFFPVGFLSFFGYRELFIGLPFFLQQLLSIRNEDHTIYYHYSAKLIPLIFMAAIYGIRSQLKIGFLNRKKWVLMVFLSVAVIASNLFFGYLKTIPGYFSVQKKLRFINDAKGKLVAQVPPEAAVVTTFEFLPHLSSRAKVYSFHHVYIGKYTLSFKDYTLPKDVEFALINFDDYLTFTSFYAPENYLNIQKFLTQDQWELLDVMDNIALFRKGQDSVLSLYEIQGSYAGETTSSFVVEDTMEALEYRIQNETVRPDEKILLNFIWKARQQTQKDYWTAYRLVDEEGVVVHEYWHPICYRIYPTFAWKKEQIIKENSWIWIPPGTKKGPLWLKMSVFDRTTAGRKGGEAKGASVATKKTDLFDTEGWINLGKIEVVAK